MKTIAQQAGVTQATVSMCLANNPRIPEATRTRIQALARKLGYQPNPYVSTLMRLRRQGRPLKEKPTLALICGQRTATGWRDHRAAPQRSSRPGFPVAYVETPPSVALDAVPRPPRTGTSGLQRHWPQAQMAHTKCTIVESATGPCPMFRSLAPHQAGMGQIRNVHPRGETLARNRRLIPHLHTIGPAHLRPPRGRSRLPRLERKQAKNHRWKHHPSQASGSPSR